LDLLISNGRIIIEKFSQQKFSFSSSVFFTDFRLQSFQLLQAHKSF